MNTATSPNDHAITDLTIQLPAKVVGILHEIATVKNVGINALISGYISNGIEHDQLEVNRKCFFDHVREVLEKHNVPAEAIAEIGDKFSY